MTGPVYSHITTNLGETKQFYNVQNVLAGRELMPNAKFQFKFKSDEEVIYDVVYETDQFQRRRTDYDGSRGRHALFFGCSFTFGTGLDQQSTLPSQFAKQSKYNSYNYGVPSYGTFNILANLSNRALDKEVAEDIGHFFYIYIPGHIQRNLGLNFYIPRPQNSPLYEIENHRLQYTGTVGQRFPIATPILSFLNQFRFFQSSAFFQTQLENYRRTEKTDWAFAYAVKEMKDIYLNTFPNGKFHFVNFPASPLHESLHAKLIELDIDVIDVRDKIDFTPSVENWLHYPEDAHPSKNFNKRFAKILLEEVDPNDHADDDKAAGKAHRQKN